MKKLSRNKKQTIGFSFISAAILLFLIALFFVEYKGGSPKPVFQCHPWILFTIVILIVIAFNLIFTISGILFDNKEYEPNEEITKIVKKIRYRGVLFNNIAIILFILSILVIFISFYLINKSIGAKDIYQSLSTNIGASIILIFLVQLLFKVFKYLLRVAAFYNARADAIEFYAKDQKISLDKLMDLFTPEKYEISELEKVSLFDGIVDAIKSKLGK